MAQLAQGYIHLRPFHMLEADLKLHAEFRAIIADVKLLCLSELFDNILMWSHYAKDHTGVVIRLTCIEELDSAWGAARLVRYEKKMPLLLDEEQTIMMMSGKTTVDKEAALHNSVYCKASDWAYEKEWRLFGGRDATKQYEDIPFHTQELTGVYLGCRISAPDRDKMIELVTQKYPHADLFVGKKAERTFTLEFEKIPILGKS
jgi:hypothetical protein